MARPSAPLIWLLLASLAAAAVSVFTPGVASAQEVDCRGARVVIHGGEPESFELPRDAGETLTVDSALDITVEDPPRDPSIHWSVLVLGRRLSRPPVDVGPGPTKVDLADLPFDASGRYEIEGTLRTGSEEVCTLAFSVRLGGFGGPLAVAAAAATAAAGIGAAGSTVVAAPSARIKLSVELEAKRRRPRGVRRFLPVLAWKPTIVSTLIGALTGLFSAALVQQGGLAPLSVPTAVYGIIAGGGVTFGVSYLSALRTFLQSPEEPQ